MKWQFYFFSYVDDILVVCLFIHKNVLIFTFMSKCFFTSLWPGEFFDHVADKDTGEFFEK